MKESMRAQIKELVIEANNEINGKRKKHTLKEVRKK